MLQLLRGSINDHRKHSLTAMGCGASKPAPAAHGFKGPVAVNETSETGSVAPELSCDDAPPGTLLTTEPSQTTADTDTTDGLSDAGE